MARTTEQPTLQHDPPVVFDNVWKSFGSLEILRGLSFEVPRGQTLAIMGPSGTGKSVALRHLIGLMQPDSGRVIVDGYDMSSIKPKELRELRKRMGYVFQEGALINWLTVTENLALPLRENTNLSNAEILDRVAQKLELVHTPDAGDKMPSELSGGMKKRIGIARALITDPDIILYDEPNAGLDPEISAAINHLIREVADRLDVTSVVVEHRLICIKMVADEVLLLDKGQVVLRDTPDNFFKSDHPRLVKFLGESLAILSNS